MKYKILFIFTILSHSLYTESEPEQQADRPLFYRLLNTLPTWAVKVIDPITPTSSSWSLKQAKTASNKEINDFLRYKEGCNNPTPTSNKEESQQKDNQTLAHIQNSFHKNAGYLLGGALVTIGGLYYLNK